jgi:hypothetical protein
LVDEDQIPKEYGGKAKWKLPGRPSDWSDVEDSEDENGYHPLTLNTKQAVVSKKEKKKRKEKKGNNNNSNNE